jgi:1,4-alpha-glucan branching enzyme
MVIRFMNIAHEKPTIDRYSAWNNVKPINFFCDAPAAKAVYLVGDFNRWNPTTHPMEQRLDGWWFLQVSLTHGHHQYRFLVDGKPMLDPHAAGVVHNEINEEVSLIAIS